MEYLIPADICDRALQHCGAGRLDPVLRLNDKSRNARETGFAYGKLRRAELRRNVWRFATRRSVIRAIDSTTMMLAPALWVATTTYFVNSIVSDAIGNLWISNIRNNLGNDPVLTTYWEPYFGPMTVSLYDSTVSPPIGYFSGELVYTAVGDGTQRTYLSLESGNEDNPATATAYSATATYFKNQVVTSASIAYMSLVDLNIGNTPVSSPTKWTATFVGGVGSNKWLQIGGTEFPYGVGLTTLGIIYPLGSGPSTQQATRNVFRLPNGFLRLAPQNPKGSTTWLGGPSGVVYTDWNLENNYLVTAETGPLSLRFIADVTDVRLMDDMFCEGLAARVGVAVCDILTQSLSQLTAIEKVYDVFMGEARKVNAIEMGYDDPPDDNYLTVRY